MKLVVILGTGLVGSQVVTILGGHGHDPVVTRVRRRNAHRVYAWAFEERHVWRPPRMKLPGRVLERVTRAR